MLKFKTLLLISLVSGLLSPGQECDLFQLIHTEEMCNQESFCIIHQTLEKPICVYKAFNNDYCNTAAESGPYCFELKSVCLNNQCIFQSNKIEIKMDSFYDEYTLDFLDSDDPFSLDDVLDFPLSLYRFADTKSFDSITWGTDGTAKNPSSLNIYYTTEFINVVLPILITSHSRDIISVFKRKMASHDFSVIFKDDSRAVYFNIHFQQSDIRLLKLIKKRNILFYLPDLKGDHNNIPMASKEQEQNTMADDYDFNFDADDIPKTSTSTSLFESSDTETHFDITHAIPKSPQDLNGHPEMIGMVASKIKRQDDDRKEVKDGIEDEIQHIRDKNFKMPAESIIDHRESITEILSSTLYPTSETNTPFIYLLFDLLESSEKKGLQNLIGWSEDGELFYMFYSNPNFKNMILPLLLPHSKSNDLRLKSLQSQLFNYDISRYNYIFYRKNFCKGRRDLLHLVKRRASQRESPTKSRKKQKAMNNKER